jgi:Protein phosphatase 2C
MTSTDQSPAIMLIQPLPHYSRVLHALTRAMSPRPSEIATVVSHAGDSADVPLPYVATVGLSPSGPSFHVALRARETPNFWSSDYPTFRFGVQDERGPRRTMEDAHSYVFDYDGIHGQGFFAVFDGHAGREAADWCGKNFHEVSLEPSHSMMSCQVTFCSSICSQPFKPTPMPLYPTCTTRHSTK